MEPKLIIKPNLLKNNFNMYYSQSWNMCLNFISAEKHVFDKSFPIRFA